jgi:hypothetical protein
LALSDKAREKLRDTMMQSREKLMNASPEERMSYMKKVFERVESEDKASRGR